MSEATAALPQRIPRRSSPAPERRRAQLRLVDDRARRRNRRRRWVIRLWAVGIVAAALLGVMVHALMAEGQMRAGRLATAIDAEEQRYEDARLHAAEIASPAAITCAARRLGLVPAKDTAIVQVPGVRPTPSSPDPDATRSSESVKSVLGGSP